MTPAEYGLYTHLREISYKSNPKHSYRFDDRKLAERFIGTSKTTINRLRQALAEKRFIVWMEPKKRAAGKFASRLGRILDHTEWAALNPGKCIHNAVETTEAVPFSPVPNSPIHQSQVSDYLSHSERHRSHFDDSPVPDSGVHLSHGRDISIIGQIHTDKSNLKSMPDRSKIELPKSDSANHQLNLEASPVPGTGDYLSVPPMGQVEAPLGLVRREGQWFTETGVKVHPDALALLLKDKEAA
jgi:hypothetical protein